MGKSSNRNKRNRKEKKKHKQNKQNKKSKKCKSSSCSICYNCYRILTVVLKHPTDVVVDGVKIKIEHGDEVTPVAVAGKPSDSDDTISVDTDDSKMAGTNGDNDSVMAGSKANEVIDGIFDAKSDEATGNLETAAASSVKHASNSDIAAHGNENVLTTESSTTAENVLTTETSNAVEDSTVNGNVLTTESPANGNVLTTESSNVLNFSCLFKALLLNIFTSFES